VFDIADLPDLSIQIVEQISCVFLNECVVVYLCQRVGSLLQLKNVVVALADYHRHLRINDVKYLDVNLKQQVIFRFRRLKFIKHRLKALSQLYISGEC